MGGATFVSSSTAKYFIEKGYEVDILTRGLKNINYSGFREHIICNRKSKEQLGAVLNAKRYDFIIDISAYTKEDVELLLTFIDRRSLEKYIFCSSGSVYKPSNDFVSEAFEKGENPNWGKYGMDKKEAEDFIIASGIPYIIFRPTYIYGQDNNLYREAYFFDRIMNGEVIPMPYGNNIKTQFVHINDLVKVFESAINSEGVGEIYNLTNPEVVTWEDLILKCEEIVGKKANIKRINVKESNLQSRAYFPFRDVTYLLNIDKLSEDKLYIPNISLEEGLKRTFKWYIDKKPTINDIKMLEGVNELLKNL